MVQTSLSAWLKKSANNSASAPVPSSSNLQNHQLSIPLISTDDYIPAKNTTLKGASCPQDSALIPLVQANSQVLKPFETRKQLPANAQLDYITSDNVQLFRRLISLLLPVPYSDKFYAETVTDPVASSISRVVIWSDDASFNEQKISQGARHLQAASDSKARVVAGIRCRLLQISPARRPDEQGQTDPSLYISTIATLSPYRSHGLASALLSEVTAAATQLYGIKTVTAHVWEANDEAREWYAKLGFREVRLESDYYTRIKPTAAWLLEYELPG